MARDIYIHADTAYIPQPDGAIKKVSPSEFSSSFITLYDACKEAYKSSCRNSFDFIFEESRCRVTAINSIDGLAFCIRKFQNNVPDLADLKLGSLYVNQMLAPGLSGLVIFSGRTASGKTTSASAFLSSRLKLFGGIAITVEDPVELPLQHSGEKSTCYQIDAHTNGGFSNVLRDVVRMTPDIIMIGEIRDSETAAEAIKAGLNGHLIAATIHSDSGLNSLLRLQSFAADIMGNSTRALLAQSISQVIYQQITNPIGQTVVETEFLNFATPDFDSLRNMISDDRISALRNAIETQRTKQKMYKA